MEEEGRAGEGAGSTTLLVTCTIYNADYFCVQIPLLTLCITSYASQSGLPLHSFVVVVVVPLNLCIERKFPGHLASGSCSIWDLT